MKFYSENV